MKLSGCNQHQRKLGYFCFDKMCKCQKLICILCVKNDHSNCNEETLLSIEDAVKMINNSQNWEQDIHKLATIQATKAQILEKKKEELLNYL